MPTSLQHQFHELAAPKQTVTFTAVHSTTNLYCCIHYCVVGCTASALHTAALAAGCNACNQPYVAASSQACLKFADLFAEESREVLLELNLPAAAQPGEQQLIKVEVSFSNPSTGAVTTSSQVLQLARNEAPPADQPRDPLVGNHRSTLPGG